MRASGLWIGSRSRISLSEILQKATTGAPVRSEPKLGNACACLPSVNAAAESNSAAVTVPWPPRPWNRTSNINIACFLVLGRSVLAVDDDHGAVRVVHAPAADRADQ